MKHECPDDETLAAYFEGLLPPAQEELLHAGIATCRSCARTFADLGLVLRSMQTASETDVRVPHSVTARAVALWPEAPVARAVRLAARWLGGVMQPLADALAPLPAVAVRTRGAEAAVESLRYEVALGDLPVEVELSVGGPELATLAIRPLKPPAPGLLMRLQSSGETRAMSTLGADGTRVEALPPGSYELSLESAGTTLGRLTVDLATDRA